MQQGRVTLDADFNELVELLDHRLRAEIVDLFGRCVVSRETPDAFLIAASGGGADHRPRPRVRRRPAGGEPRRATRSRTTRSSASVHGTSADRLRSAALPARTPAPLPHQRDVLAYLDVWRREVTVPRGPGPAREGDRRRHRGADRRRSGRLAPAARRPTAPTCESQLPGWRRADGAVGGPADHGCGRRSGDAPTRARSRPTAATAERRTGSIESRSTTAGRSARRRSRGRATTPPSPRVSTRSTPPGRS